MKTKKIGSVLGIIMMLFTVLLISCAKDNQGPDEVFMEGSKYNPATITVTAGTTVTWTNKDDVTHSVTSDTGLFESGDLSKGDSFKYTFSAQGTYDYHCRFHGAMIGKVIVE
jgi:plastocyanin